MHQRFIELKKNTQIMKNHLLHHHKMHTAIAFLIILSAGLLYSGNSTQAQTMMFHGPMEATSSIFAISPTFYKGIKYGRGEFDYNVLPFYLEAETEGIANIRLYPWLNLERRKSGEGGVKNFGIGLAVPLYYSRSDFENPMSHHFYVAPGFNLLLNFSGDDFNGAFNFYAEPGYSLRFSHWTGINVGVQLGKTLISDSDFTQWQNFVSLRLAWYWVFLN